MSSGGSFGSGNAVDKILFLVRQPVAVGVPFVVGEKAVEVAVRELHARGRPVLAARRGVTAGVAERELVATEEHPGHVLLGVRHAIAIRIDAASPAFSAFG